MALNDRPPPETAPEVADIPVLVDDVKRFEDGGFEMTRCTFFTIEVTGAVHDWLADLRSRDVPFIIFGASVVLHRPDGRRSRFTDPESVEALFGAVESVEGLIVETAHIWLPNFLVVSCLGEAVAYDRADSRRQVIRVRAPLFQEALRFVQAAIDAEMFGAVCRALAGRASPAEPVLERSDAESAVFQEWSRIQIVAARDNYLEQRDDGRGVLRWRDDKGIIHRG